MKYQLSRVILGPGLKLLARTTVIGEENVPATGAAILASNHLSVLDSFYLPFMLERPVTFAAKSEYFTGKRLTDRVVGAYLRATKQLSVDRDGARAAQEMLEAALGLLNEGSLFGIYPEGTRSPDGKLYRGRTGVGWLALHSGAPVIPVAMVGTEKLLPPGAKVPHPGRIEIRIGQPLPFDECKTARAARNSAGRSPTRSSPPSASCLARSTPPSTPQCARSSSRPTKPPARPRRTAPTRP